MSPRLFITSALWIWAAAGVAHAGPDSAKVTAWGQHYGAKVVYSLTIQNLSDQAIRRVRVGKNLDPSGGGGPELTIPPRLDGPTFWLASDVATSPVGWAAAVAFEEESEKFAIEWIEAGYFRQIAPAAAADAPPVMSGAGGIAPGASVSTFAISLPEEDYAYVNGHATISVGDSSSSVQIVKGDSVPPTISFQVDRVNQNDTRGAWAIFNVQYSVSDNYDPGPVYSFEPITANQPVAPGDIVTEKNEANAWNVKLRNVPGRTYTLRVRASDASGNVAVKQYQYSVGP